MPARPKRPWLVACLALWGVGCGGGPTSTTGPAASAPTSAASAGGEEASVRPGVNERYYEDGALEKWSSIFEGESREVVRRRDAIVEAARIEQGSRVADIGAGTGLFTLALAEAAGADGSVHAVEIVPAFLERLREIAARAPHANVHVVEGQERSATLPASSVDVALMINVYHHLEYPVSYLRTVQRSLAPGGRLVVVDFRRIEGVTSPAMLKHVRADQQTVVAEIESAGFRLAREEGFLKENYFLEFSPNAPGAGP